MKNCKSLEYFKSKNKELFIYFKKHSPYFPGHCMDICLLLKYFAKEYFDEELEIIKGNKKLLPNKKLFHMWLKKDNDIFDLSLFQFYIGNNKFKRLDDDTTYSYCIEEVQQGNVIFTSSFYNNIFENMEPVSLEYISGYYFTDIHTIKINKEEDTESVFHKFLADAIVCLRKNM